MPLAMVAVEPGALTVATMPLASRKPRLPDVVEYHPTIWPASLMPFGTRGESQHGPGGGGSSVKTPLVPVSIIAMSRRLAGTIEYFLRTPREIAFRLKQELTNAYLYAR